MIPVAEQLSVIVPVRDQAAYIEDALESLLEQAGGSPSIVVVDDGSTDGSADAARSRAPAARVLVTAGRGPAAARNTGVAATRTPLVAFCDADDVWPLDRCQRDLAVLADHPGSPGVIGRTRFDADSPDLLTHFRFPGPEPVSDVWHLGALTIRRQAWDRVGPLDEDLTSFEDHDWFLRASEEGLILVPSGAVALIHRVRRGSSNAGRTAPTRDRLALMQRAAARRRGAGSP